MTTPEIFNEFITHNINGVMLHEELTNYFAFLGLNGYKVMQNYHAKEETDSVRKAQKFYIKNYQMLPEIGEIKASGIIPANWYGHDRAEVDRATKRTAVKNAFNAWHEWETDTKDKYTEWYHGLQENNDIDGADYMCKYICDVSDELKEITEHMVFLNTIDYDLTTIATMQRDIKYKYRLK